MPMSQWARQKLTRSWWLFSELLGRVDAWNAAGEFTAEVQVLADRTALEFLTPAGFRPPVSEWALLVGDAVHNARSALDAEIWHLAHRDDGKPTNPTRVAFPVTSDARAWVNSIKALETVSAESLERARLAQPWVDSPAAPDQHWLSILSRLDNDDKHRGRVVAVPLQEGLSLAFDGLSLGDPLPEGGYLHIWGSGLDGTEAAGTAFARFGLGALINGTKIEAGTVSVRLAPAVSVLDQLIPVAALQAEMLPYLRGLLDEVGGDGPLHEATILPDRFEPDAPPPQGR